MPDSEWLKRISKALQNAPSILDQFKDLVGFIPDYDQDSSSSSDEQQQQEFSRVDLIPIRSKIDRLSQETYPQFYINCQEGMQNEQAYNTFIHVLNDASLSDQAWLLKIHQALKDHANLLEQLQEIVAYETEQDVYWVVLAVDNKMICAPSKSAMWVLTNQYTTFLKLCRLSLASGNSYFTLEKWRYNVAFCML